MNLIVIFTFFIAAALVRRIRPGSTAAAVKRMGPGDVNASVNALFQDAIADHKHHSDYVGELDVVATLTKMITNPLLGLLELKGRRFEERNDTRKGKHNKFEQYEDCVKDLKSKLQKSITKRFMVAYIGQPELKLTCIDFCKKPTGDHIVEWFYLSHYGSNETSTNGRKNAFLSVGGNPLVIKNIDVQDTGLFYCKYDGFIYYEYWVHVEKNDDVSIKEYVGDEDFVSRITTISQVGIQMRIIYGRWSGCINGTFEELLLGEYSFWNYKWWTGRLFSLRWWKLTFGNLLAWIFSDPSYVPVLRQRKRRFGAAVMNLDPKASLEIKKNWSTQHAPFKLFKVNRYIPSNSHFIPHEFSTWLYNKSILYEEKCANNSLFEVSYREYELKKKELDGAQITCPGANPNNPVTWTKDGRPRKNSQRWKVDKVSNKLIIGMLLLEDHGKYTCWEDGDALASTVIRSTTPFPIVFKELPFTFLIISLDICFIMLIYFVYRSALLFLIELINFCCNLIRTGLRAIKVILLS